jgi:hypothetical protein
LVSCRSISQFYRQDWFLVDRFPVLSTREKVSALTPQQILDALRRHLDLNALSIVKAGDFKKAASTK